MRLLRGLKPRRRGVVTRVARPFIFLVLVLGLIAGAELSSAIATEFLSGQEAELGRLLNAERLARGLPELSHSDGLRTIARRHAQRMMTEGTIFHNERLQQEVEAVFPDWAKIGENVGVGPSIPSVHRAFMDSPGHRANILDPDWGWMGIGAVSGGRRLFMTENFLNLQPGAPRPLPARYRLEGETRTATAEAIADFAFTPGTAGGAVVADMADFHGALAGAALAGSIGGPILLTPRDQLSPDAEAALRRALGSTNATVYLVGGPFSGGVASSISALGYRVVTLGGADHVETGAEVAAALPRPNTAFITTVEAFPDALAASAVSAVSNTPILYTDPDRLSPGTADALRKLGIARVYVVGGPLAVSTGVEDQLRAAGVSVAGRLAGPDRYATALAVADHGLRNGLRPDHLAVATGLNFPDALAGGALGQVLGAPVLLTHPIVLTPQVASWIRAHRTSVDAVYLLGGEAALAGNIENGLADALR